MRIRKRFLILFLIGGVFIWSRCSSLSFRETDSNQSLYLQERGQESPTFHQYKAEGRVIHYTAVEEDDKPLVLLVHGSPGSSSAFLDYLADTSLTNIASTIAVDRPGFGYSEFGRTERILEVQSKAFRPILEKYKDKKTILVGHSFGGPVIARMAMDFPELVDGLIIIAGSIAPELEPREWWRPVVNFPIFRWLTPPSLKVCNQEILPLWKELEKMLPYWEKITCPVTLIHGDLDNLVPVENVDFAKKMLVNSKKVDVEIIKGGNHFILWSLRDQITEVIKGHLVEEDS